MTTQTKAADPVLPPPSHRHPMSGEPIWDEAAARACYEKARADLIAELRPVAGFFKDEDGVLFTSRSGVPHTNGWVELAIIPEK